MAEPTPGTLEKGATDETRIREDDEKELDPDVIGWEGPDDPENAMNWPTGKKVRQLVLMAFNTFITWVSLFLCIPDPRCKVRNPGPA